MLPAPARLQLDRLRFIDVLLLCRAFWFLPLIPSELC
jgi:hypothetical protein